jgi:hypothetical protein
VDVQQHGVPAPWLEAERTHDPCVDLGAVRRDGGEALGESELVLLGERPRHLGQSAIARVELGRGRRGRRRVHDLALGRVVPCHPSLAGDNGLGRAGPVGAHPVQVVVAAILEHEEQRVGLPDRLADLRVGSAVAVERGREHAPIARRDVEHGNLTVAREVEPALGEATGDQGSVGRPGWSLVPAVAAGQPLRLAPPRVDEKHVADELNVPVLVTCRGERDAPPVGGPGRIPALVVAVRELSRRR